MENQPKHTPGPWKATRNNMRVRSIDAPVCRLWMLRSGQGVANARLIAAAPELLEALKAATSFPLSDSWVPAALAAIAKAEGRGA